MKAGDLVVDMTIASGAVVYRRDSRASR